MNQNNPNGINNFDPITGQPVQQSQPIQNNNQFQQHTPVNRKKAVIIIIILLIIVSLIATIIILNNKKSKDDNSPQTNDVIKENQNNNTNSGTVNPDTNLTYDENGAFLFSIEDVFTISDRGTVVTGRVLRGKLNLNDEVQVIGLNHEIITTTVTGIEMFRETRDYATIGDNAGLLLKGVSRDEVERGQVVSIPNSIIAFQKFEAEVYILKEEEGGRQTSIFTNYSPQFYFRTTDISGTMTLPNNIEKVSPGDTANVTIELEVNVAMEVGTEFSIRDGGKTIAKGKVIKTY